MKKITVTIFLIISSIIAIPQNTIIKPKVDERTELLSIVFRLVGATGYVNNDIADYAKDIDDYFAPFKGHEVVKFARELRKTREVSFGAIMSMAINIEIKDEIRFKDNLSESSLDEGWGKENSIAFLKLLNKFYTESKFHEFFMAHSVLYRTAENNFNKTVKPIDMDWFQNFYGLKSNVSFNMVISLTNGGNYYGPKVQYKDGKQDFFSIIGSWETDSLKQPIYAKDLGETIIHEFNHSFCNPLIDSFYNEMARQSGKFFKQSLIKFNQQYYGNPKIILYEILVRACVIKYIQQNETDVEKIKHLISEEENNGFLWIENLVNLLSDYEKNREKFLTLKEFMPEIVKLQNGLSPKHLQQIYDSKCPRIVSTNIKTGDKNVDPNLKQLILKFDRPMNIYCWGLSSGKLGGDYSPNYPEDILVQWDETTKTEFTQPISLKPNKRYSISIPAQFFRDKNYYHLIKKYYLDFKTRKK